MRGIWIGMLLAVALLVAPPAAGQQAGSPSPEQLDAARALAEAGFQLYERGDYATALDRFIKAEEIYHAAPHVLFIARASEKVGKLVEARKAYEKLANEEFGASAPAQFQKAQAEARAELEQLQPRIPMLQITVTGVAAEDATVSVDGQAVAAGALPGPIEVNPGEHVVELSAEGRESSSQTVTAQESTPLEVELIAGALLASGGSGDGGDAPPPPPPPDGGDGPSIVPPLIVGGVGVALIVVGAITGAMTLSDAAELKDRCPQNPCPPENESLGDDIVTMSTVSTIGFIAGGAAVAAGVLWLVLQGGDETGVDETAAAGPTVRLLVGGPYVGLEGTF